MFLVILSIIYALISFIIVKKKIKIIENLHLLDSYIVIDISKLNKKTKLLKWPKEVGVILKKLYNDQDFKCKVALHFLGIENIRKNLIESGYKRFNDSDIENIQKNEKYLFIV